MADDNIEVAPADRMIAYFSMEIGFDPSIPTYSGGLGILAGDTLKACADLKVPVVGVTLVSARGYFTQHLDPNTGLQTELPTEWTISDKLQLQPAKAIVHIQGRQVTVRAWKRDIVGVNGFKVPIIFLDTNQPENSEFDRGLTGQLYGGDRFYRLCQEVVLGVGGVRMLRALGYTGLNRYHMNEGHAAFLALELFKEHALMSGTPLNDFEACKAISLDWVRKRCVFTTHTPVAAGHDKFPYDMVGDVLRTFLPVDIIQRLGGQDALNMTLLALNLSHYVNSVAKKHMDVSQHLFPGYHFSSITNGVHSVTWTAPEIQEIFDKHIPGWRQDSFELRHALAIPKHEIWDAHQKVKERLIAYVNMKHNAGFDPNVFTIGFARRATAYKRAHLLFHDIQRLRKLGGEHKIQIIFGGKAHPNDGSGKELIQKLFWNMGEVRDVIKVVYLEDYNMEIAKMLVPGVDIWLNTPARPQEASGTSGMKAAHNGVPQFSILDGWWIEGHLEGVTGWRLGPIPTEQNEFSNNDDDDARELYEKLEHIILPLYYENNTEWRKVMRNTIAFNGSYFNTHRMVQQYVLNAYLL